MALGPGIRVAQAALVQKRPMNALPDATFTHWHGIRIDNAIDGCAGLTQEPIPHDFVRLRLVRARCRGLLVPCA
ncbi:multicopper oxidase domain-containing protein [Marivita sp.]|uniref:multicopper oxidase domain-containing protein n=1 Tax=Marivita sp. TaxID=2003365 RepID=UPI003B523D68